VTTCLSGEEMRALVMEHSLGEHTRDWPRAIATLSDRPVYEFYPYRIRITELDAITEAWTRLLPLPCFNSSDGGEQLGYEEFVGDDSVMTIAEWTFPDSEGRVRRTKIAVRYGFEGHLMKSETVFMDRSMTTFVDHAFDDDFLALPGVERI
jgi:hypothetical protein